MPSSIEGKILLFLAQKFQKQCRPQQSRLVCDDQLPWFDIQNKIRQYNACIHLCHRLCQSASKISRAAYESDLEINLIAKSFTRPEDVENHIILWRAQALWNKFKSNKRLESLTSCSGRLFSKMSQISAAKVVADRRSRWKRCIFLPLLSVLKFWIYNI